MHSIQRTMKKVYSNFSPLFTWKGYMLMVVASITFANIILVIFGNTIPNVFLVIFGNTIPGIFQTVFKVAASGVILGAVTVFAMAWLLRAKPHNRPRSYRVVIFDVFGSESIIEGLRLNFQNHDVAWSHMRDYKKRYPLHNFALVGDVKGNRPTIYRYI